MQMLAIGSGVQSIQNWVIGLGIPEGLAFWLTALICVAGASLVTVGLMVVMWKYRKVFLRDRDLKLDKFSAPSFPGISLFNALHIPVPKFSFDLSGFKGIGMALSVVAVAFGLAFSFVIVATDDTPSWPEPGAAYNLGSINPTVGTPLAPDPITPEQKSQTLEVKLADGTRLEKLEVDLQMGKVGLTDCIAIERGAGTGYLWVDTLSMDKLTAPTLIMSASYVHQLNLSGRTDGHHTGPVQNSTTADVTIESLRESGVYTGSGRVDRLVVTLLGDAYISTMTVTGKCSVGAVDLDFLRVGTFNLTNVTIGDDGNVNTAAVDIDSTTTVHSVSDQFTDVPITVK